MKTNIELNDEYRISDKTLKIIEFIVDNFRFMYLFCILLFDIFNQAYFKITDFYLNDFAVMLLIGFSTNMYKLNEYRMFYILITICYFIIKLFFFDMNVYWLIPIGALFINGNLLSERKKKSSKN